MSLNNASPSRQNQAGRDSSEVSVAATNSSFGCVECKQCCVKQAEIERLRGELDEWQQRCRLSEEQGQRARDELQALESEMEELHDNFKEEENEQFEQVKQELDACLKNCKILQIRLSKSERQYSQLEQVKQMLERQLLEQRQTPLHEQTTSTSGDATDCDSLVATTTKGGWQTTFELVDGAQTPMTGESSTNSPQVGEFVKLSVSEYDQMLRDLNDTSERERDLQEQIKYSQEEAQLKGERLQAIEAENEILLGRINKLTLANSSLRSSTMLTGEQQTKPETGLNLNENRQKLRELCEQNEQLKLALELAQSETERLRTKIHESSRELEAREQALQEAETRLQRLANIEQDTQNATGLQSQQHETQTSGTRKASSNRFELECRQLRARLVHSERECRQLRSQLECLGHGQSRTSSASTTNRAGLNFRSHSLDSQRSSSDQRQQQQQQHSDESTTQQQLERQCKSLLERNQQLEMKVQKLVEMSSESFDHQRTNLESELIEKLKAQLDSSESELAKAKSRLVELDIECGRAQRQHKRLMNSLESCGSSGGEFQLLRRNKLPSESARDALSRQELRQAIRDLELDIDDLVTMVKAKECLVKEHAMAAAAATGQQQVAASNQADSASSQQQTSEQQVRSLRRLLDQEHLLSSNLKLDVANLEQENQELKLRHQVLEREGQAMEEELDKLRQVMGELRAELEESENEREKTKARNRDLSETVNKLKLELEQARKASAQAAQTPVDNNKKGTVAGSGPPQQQNSQKQQQELLVMARDLSELKVKNGFLMRQLEMAREDAAKQLEETRASLAAQQKRAVELAELELRERHLQEGQQLRDELNDTKQKFSQLQRQATRQEEETNQERDRARAMERDWRRDKSQWQQAREQLEGQLTIEKRSSEFRLKEAEAAIRDKERSLMSVQDRCVQLERDLKRLQNKYHLLEENNESKVKQLERDLETRTKELNELTRYKQHQEERQYDIMKRLNDEKSTLKETLETIKRSYDEKLVEARQLRELLVARQEQAYRERHQLTERIETLNKRLTELTEQETQTKLLKQRLETQERQVESARRELSIAKEERTKLRDRCDELEKRELITKTSSISGLSISGQHHHQGGSSSSSSFLRPFGSKAQLVGRPVASETRSGTSPISATRVQAGASGEQAHPTEDPHQPLVEKLSGKINDQRNLINMLRQQWSETQMELKQVRLLQSSERAKWQAQVAQLTGRLNECEEKLAYETLLVHTNQSLVDQLARPKLEANWTIERQANLELIKQQQSQIELLTRDLKKISQAHELLRLHSKQLETHNNKLSKKLIEIQQQQQTVSFASQQHDRRIESSYERLLEKYSRLNQEMRPLIEVVAKIVNSLDAPDQASGASGRLGDSTERPLRAGSISAARFDSDDSDAGASNESMLLASQTIQTSRPAHQLNKAAQQHTRLTRLLAGGKAGARERSVSPSARPSVADPSKTTTTGGGISPGSNMAASSSKVSNGPARTTRRVRVKCSTLGITTAEKKQLKLQLKKLNDALNDDAGDEDTDKATRYDELASSNIQTALSTLQANKAHSTTVGKLAPRGHTSSQRAQPLVGAAGEETDQSSQRSQASRVRWQLDSDLESERSWSLEPSCQDVYRRFPQASPASSSGGGGGRHSYGGLAGASLTDYESESSMTASDYSLSGYPAKTRTGPSGAESDSGIATTKVARKKSSSGFKGRLSNTLRNISRSITGGFGSDTEEAGGTSRVKPDVVRRDATDTNKTDKSASILKEIRV